MTDSDKNTPPTAGTADQVGMMDNMYRYTRHVYDLTRKYYLFGRDRLIKQMALAPNDHILEVGCGTGRNLILLAKRCKDNQQLFGLDAANVMIETAQKNVAAKGLGDRIHLTQCLAEQVDAKKTFGLDQQFDTIFFSYSLSMIPTWPQALDAALANLKPDGRIYIVDFWDQADLPKWFAGLLKWWLKMFHVHHRPELIEHMKQLDADGRAHFKIESIGGRYAYLATLTPTQ